MQLSNRREITSQCDTPFKIGFGSIKKMSSRKFEATQRRKNERLRVINPGAFLRLRSIVSRGLVIWIELRSTCRTPPASLRFWCQIHTREMKPLHRTLETTREWKNNWKYLIFVDFRIFRLTSTASHPTISPHETWLQTQYVGSFGSTGMSRVSFVSDLNMDIGDEPTGATPGVCIALLTGVGGLFSTGSLDVVGSTNFFPHFFFFLPTTKIGATFSAFFFFVTLTPGLPFTAEFASTESTFASGAGAGSLELTNAARDPHFIMTSASKSKSSLSSLRMCLST